MALNPAAAAVLSVKQQQQPPHRPDSPTFSPEMVIALRNQGSLLHKQNNFDAAIARFSEAIHVLDKLSSVTGAKSVDADTAAAAAAATAPSNSEKQKEDILGDKTSTRAILLALRSFSYLKRGGAAHESLRDAREAAELDPSLEMAHLRFVEANMAIKDYKMASNVCRARILCVEEDLRRTENLLADLEHQFLPEEEEAGDGNNENDNDDDKKEQQKKETKTKMAQETEQQKQLQQRKKAELEQQVQQREAALESYSDALDVCYQFMTNTGELQKPDSIKVTNLASKAMKAHALARGDKIETESRQKKERADDYCSHGGPDPVPPEVKTFIGNWFRSGSGTMVQRALGAYQETDGDPLFWNALAKSCLSLATTAAFFDDFDDMRKFVKAAILCRVLLKDGAHVKDYVDEDFKVDEKKAPDLYKEIDKIKTSTVYLLDFVKKSVPCKCLEQHVFDH